LLGVALLESIRPALQFLRAEPQWEKAIQGAIILVAVSAEAFQFPRRKHAGASPAGR
jgi:rhamnose transport system permease protein